MDIDMNISLDEEDTDVYSSPMNNYLRLLETIEYIENDGRITEDWIEEHKQHILKYRKQVPNFKHTDKDLEDPLFRQLASETETIMSNLVYEIKWRKKFNVKIYLLLNKNIKEMCDILYGEDELLRMVQELSM